MSSVSDDVSGDHPCVTDDEDCESSTEMQTLLRQDYDIISSSSSSIKEPVYDGERVLIPSVFTSVSRPPTLPVLTNITSGANRKMASPSFGQRISSLSPQHTTPRPSNEIIIHVTALSRLQLPETTLGNGTFYPRVVTRTTETPSRSGFPDGMSSFYPEFSPMTINIGLLSGVAVAVSVLLCTIVYVLRKCCRQELVVVQQEEKQVDQKISNERAVLETNGLLRTSHDLPKRRDVKEWYV